MDRAGFEALVQAYGDSLYRTALWMCGDPQQAEDLVQETLLRAWRGLGRLRDERAVRGWLITILRREHARRLPRRLPAAALDPDQLTAAAPEPATTLSIRAALAALPGAQREVLVLQLVWGFSCAEIGDLLGASPTAVGTRLFRARAALREAMAHKKGGLG